MNQTIDRSAPGVRVTVLRDERAPAGEPVDLRGRILSFTYEDSEKKADKVTLELDNFDLSLFEREELMGGSLLEVSWGYPGNMAPPRRVVVKKLKGFATLTVEGQALSVLMNRTARTRVFENRTRGEVAFEVAREYGYEGLHAVVTTDGERMDVIAQSAETDAAFLRRLALKDGREFWVDDTGFHFHERRQDAAPTHVFTWHADPGRGDVLSVNVESDLGRRAGRVTVKGRDPKKKTTIEAIATAETVERTTLAEVVEVWDDTTGESQYIFNDPAAQQSSAPAFAPESELEGVSVLDSRNATQSVHASSAQTQEQAQREADARFRRAEGGAVKLSLQVVGDPSIRAKAVVKVRGISRMLSGSYYVKEAKHTINGSGYVCDLKLTRDGMSHVARGAGAKAKEQGGERNRGETREPGQPEVVEVWDDTTGESRYIVDDPVAQQTSAPVFGLGDDVSLLYRHDSPIPLHDPEAGGKG